MKHQLIKILFFSAIVFTLSCEKGTFKDSVSVSEFLSETNSNNTPCDGKLNNDGKTITIYGYISKINTLPKENKFHVYETSVEVGPRVEILAVDHADEIFEEISEHLSNLANPDGKEEYVKVSIRGKIKGTPLPNNSNCTMGASIEIDSDNDIRFE